MQREFRLDLWRRAEDKKKEHGTDGEGTHETTQTSDESRQTEEEEDA